MSVHADNRDVVGVYVCVCVCVRARVARFASCAHISMRRGYWFLPRIAFGRPLIEIIRPWMPIWVQRGFLRAYLRLVVGRCVSGTGSRALSAHK
jgi:hypothetical protein